MAGAVWNGVRQLLELLSAAVDGERGAVLSEVWEAHAGKRTFLQRERDEPVTAQRQPPALRAAEKQTMCTTSAVERIDRAISKNDARANSE